MGAQVRFAPPTRDLALYLRITDSTNRVYGAPFYAPALPTASELSVTLPWRDFLGNAGFRQTSNSNDHFRGPGVRYLH